MKPVGHIVAALAFRNELDGELAALVSDCKMRAMRDLRREGIETETAEKLIDQAYTRFMACLPMCESPIEKMMLAALSFMTLEGSFPPAIHDVASGDPWPQSFVVVAPQFVIARYRLDFLVTLGFGSKQARIAVECDGKDFHTLPRQMAADAARDAYLRAVGIATLRYPGSWIKKNWEAMADEIKGLAMEMRAA